MKKILLLVSLIACGGQTIDDIDSGGGTDSGKSDTGTTTTKACKTDSDCGKGICGFSMNDACKATGQCFPEPGAVCNAFSPGCACDGSTINIVCNGLPDGYAPAPLAYKGQCAMDGGSGGSFTCGSTSCIAGKEVCYVSANPSSETCMPSNGCTDCQCAQSMFQCVSSCKQAGSAIYIQCN